MKRFTAAASLLAWLWIGGAAAMKRGKAAGPIAGFGKLLATL
jgi:hypothetical protein